MTHANKHILMVLTSHDELGTTGKKTGVWVEEFAAPYYVFKTAGFDITIASPKGGQPPIDPSSELPDFQTADTQRFDKDEEAKVQLANTVSLSSVNADDFDAVFYPGGHGPLWDLVDNTDSIKLIEQCVSQQKPVAAVCHASAALLNAKTSLGQYLIAGKAVTGFSNSEEDAVQLSEIVPFLLEDELIARQADYQKAADWHPFTVQDGLVITGQNPASSALTAEKLIAQLS
ncbi:type 1 glutamine amidotransferase domain-containing protein [Shewanella maritima]|uniref:type 1 glutamine amidotransferase domain-containing protein n=1 Tax=Shewanella maritima TaxID=2520507 RepID=UPI00373570D7